MNKKAILIIDDKSEIIDFFRFYYDVNNVSQQFNFIYAMNYDEVFNLMLKNNLYAIITDVNLSDGNGLDILSYSLKKFPSIVRIVMTGLSKIEVKKMTSDDKRIFEYFIQKPLSIELIDGLLVTI